jgi:hypothetical protein
MPTGGAKILGKVLLFDTAVDPIVAPLKPAQSSLLESFTPALLIRKSTLASLSSGTALHT